MIFIGERFIILNMIRFNDLTKNSAGKLLVIIYLAFISLGLPDALLGVTWPVMKNDFKVQLGAAGLVSMIVFGGTVISSLNSGKLIGRLGTGKLTLISCTLTAGALLGISQVSIFTGLILLAIPLGLGAGAVDSALNHFVAGHYKVNHMNWLHAFWGIGATAGPLIMSRFLAVDNDWSKGYLTVAVIQFGIVLLLFFSLGLWSRVRESSSEINSDTNHENTAISENYSKSIMRIPGIKSTLATFFFYCSAELTIGLWGASYLVEVKGMITEVAAGLISIYYGGITIGRIINGFISFRIKNRHLILFGQILSILGAILMIVPLSSVATKVGLLFLGLGLSPVFPGLLHETPYRFGKHHSAKLMGYQMASAYVGTTFMPPVFGALASITGMKIFPIVVLFFLVTLTVLSERVVRILSVKSEWNF